MTRRLLLALAALVAVSAIGVGATFAMFSDYTVKSSSFTTAQMCIDSFRDGSDNHDPVTLAGPMFYVTPSDGKTSMGDGVLPTGFNHDPINRPQPPWPWLKWVPGDHETRSLQVNNGSCGTAAWLVSVQAFLNPSSDDPGSDVTDKFLVDIKARGDSDMEPVASGTLTQFLSGPVTLNYPVAETQIGFGTSKYPFVGSPGSKQMDFTVKLDPTAGNALQDQQFIIDFQVKAYQANNNPTVIQNP